MNIQDLTKSLDKYGYCHVPLEEWNDELAISIPSSYGCTTYPGTLYITVTTAKYKKEQDQRMIDRKFKNVSKKEQKKQEKEN